MTTPADTTFWDMRRGRIISRNGGWRIGQGVFCHGLDMMNELVGHASYMQVIILNATGILPERRVADWVEAIHICLSWPDPRIWCNQIAALAGSARSSALAATAAGLMALDARTYGTRPIIEGMHFITEALNKKKSGMSALELVETAHKSPDGKPQIMGFARPLAKGDERIPAMERVAKQLGFGIGEHLALAYEIDQILRDFYDESMNINGYASAFMSDAGFSAEETYRLCTTLGASGITACFVDQRDDVAGAFLPLRCDDVDYQGKPTRPLPE